MENLTLEERVTLLEDISKVNMKSVNEVLN
jgi:hypothetical protein